MVLKGILAETLEEILDETPKEVSPSSLLKYQFAGEQAGRQDGRPAGRSVE